MIVNIKKHGIFKIWSRIPNKRKYEVWILIIALSLISFFELLSLFLIGPLLQLFIYGKISSDLMDKFENFTILSGYDFKFILLILFVISFIFSSFGRTIITFIQANIGYGIGSDIGQIIFKNYLYKSFSEHLKMSNSEMVTLLNIKVGQVTQGTIIPLMVFLSSLFLIIVIVTALLYVNLSATIFSICFLALIYIFILQSISKILKNHGVIINKSISENTLLINESSGSIKHIILDSTHSFYLNKYKKIVTKLGLSTSIVTFLTSAPRYVIEGVAITSAIIYIYIVSNGEIISPESINNFAIFIFAIQRLLPLFQSGYYTFANLKGSVKPLEDIVRALEENIININEGKESFKKIKVDKSIALNKVEYKYEMEEYPILKNINLDIPIGSRVAIIGPSGCGKSTLINIISGLINPTNGSILIDGKALPDKEKTTYMKNVSYVDQDNFIINATVYENVALGIPVMSINKSLVRNAIKAAYLDSRINELPDKYETKLGDNGSILSSGQRQRIAIARAIYKEPLLLILDEGTNALDKETEKNIFDSLNKCLPFATIIHVTHNQTYVNFCNYVIDLKDQNLVLKPIHLKS